MEFQEKELLVKVDCNGEGGRGKVHRGESREVQVLRRNPRESEEISSEVTTNSSSTFQVDSTRVQVPFIPHHQDGEEDD